mgnify:CR=1 FL=1
MSYSGTVRCGYCGQPGHNKLGCPERRKEALARPDSYLGRLYAREQEQRQRSIANRTCTYCRKPGHNRRGCPTMKEDIQNIGHRQSEYRKEFEEKASSIGFLPGALINVPDIYTGDHDRVTGFVAMVTEINWDNVDFLLKDTDSHTGWGDRNKRLATCRVVSIYGYSDPPNEDRWNPDPKFNEVKPLTTLQLYPILKGAINPDAGFSENDLKAGASLVSPISGRLTAPKDLQITENLVRRFNLKPHARADDWEKERKHIRDPAWSKIRPKEFLEATNPSGQEGDN